jgi:hypothetical protein
MAGRGEAHPFRIAVAVLFVGVSLTFIGVIAAGIIRSLTEEMALDPATPVDGRETFAECAADLSRLRTALDERLALARRQGHQAEEIWDAWSAGWRRELSALELRCQPAASRDSPAGRALASATRDLATLAGLYGTHVVQYAREIGGAVEQADRDFAALSEAARLAPSPNTGRANR